MITKRAVYKGPLFRVCKGCSKTFLIPKVFYTAPNGRISHRWDQRVYCSKDCYKNNRILKDRISKCKNPECGKEFTQEIRCYKGKKMPSKNKHCSKECYLKNRSQMQYVGICRICGKNFTFSNHSLAKKLCSDECRDKAKLQRINKSRDKRYKVDSGTFAALLKLQDNRCAICRKQPSGKRGLAFDHCHETNQGRGLLCNKCNLGLGLFMDDWVLLDNAIEYLGHWHRKHGSSKVKSWQEVPFLN